MGADDELLDLLADTVARAHIAPTRLRPAQAEARLRIGQPRLAIVDLGAPVRPHLRVIDALNLQRVPMLVVTARDGAQNALAKPFSPRVLMARLERALHPAGG